ncbi:MAG: glycosyltransferase [Spirochaetes bacterium]|nr:glycosyltransferase [Spirochaetota bacterium]
MNEPKVSIIIPTLRIGKMLREAIPHYEKLDYSNFEIIIVVSREYYAEEHLSDKLRIRIIPGPLAINEKVQVGVEASDGEIIALTDDDAYPRSDWLKNAVNIILKDESIGAVGGPGLIPPDEPFWSRISGNIHASFVMSGSARKRIIPTSNKEHFDDELTGVNMVMRKSVFNEIGGYKDTFGFYSGEDTLLCRKIRMNGYKLVYSPNVVVFHHRRKLFFDHFKQLSNWAFHRGLYSKIFPENSRKIQHFLPSIFLFGVVIGGILSTLSNIIMYIYLSVLGLYFSLAIISSLKPNPLETLLTTIGIFFSHLVYGIYFIKGLLYTKEKYLHNKSREKRHKKLLTQDRFRKIN